MNGKQHVGNLNYKCTSPCTSCPYRKDAKLQLWDKKEYELLLDNERSQMGAVYGCHKNNGSVCIGWLMMQEKNGLPSIMLRVSLIKNKVTRQYLQSLKCASEMYETTEEMIEENYPELIT